MSPESGTRFGSPALHDRRCRKSETEFAEYLTGNWRSEHLFNLESALHLYDERQRMITSYEARLLDELQALEPDPRRDRPVREHPNPVKEKAIRKCGEHPARTTLWRFAGVDLTRIDGIGAGAAQVILTEVGLDLASFPFERHFVSWLCLSPRTAISGGKPLGKKKPNSTGATRIADVLRMAALTLQRSKTPLGAAFRRKARHKGAAVAVFARKLATLVYLMLRYGQDYVDIGEQAYEARFQRQRLASINASAQSFGYALIERDTASDRINIINDL